jgi:GT2 family glycosyltransferase
VVPVYNTDPAMLRAAVASVRAQIHDDWQLVISDDASTSPGTQAELQRIAASDERIAVHRCSERGHISRTTNAALASCTGDYVAFLDHDDELAPHALLLVAQALRADPSIDLLYTDEDKLDSHGKRCLPLFKPDWSPVLSWSQNYVGHLMCVRRSLLEQVGGMRTGAEGSQDHDLLLRLAERGAKVHHLPEVLYHWRIHEASTAARPAAKPYAHEAGRRSVLSHLQVRYPEHLLQVDDGDSAFVYQPRFRVPESARASIIIPTKDRLDLLVPCVQSILTKSTWPHFELVLLDNASSQHDTCQWLEEIQRVNSRVRVVPAHMPFNWSRLNNLGRSQAIGEVLVFLNNDTLVITPDWLQKLMQWALLPDVGTVGPMLLFEDGSVQHAGVVVGMGGWADHVYRQSQPVNYPSPYIANVVTRNVLANTGACVAIATAKFDQLGGWDETFQICGSDVELGIRAHERGLHNVYLPSVRLYHLESKTRSPHVPEVDFEQSALKYGRYRTHGDPFYNPHLDPMSTTPRPLHRLVRNLPSPRGRLS